MNICCPACLCVLQRDKFTFLCLYACMCTCWFVCTLNKSFTVRLIAENIKKMVVLWGEFCMASDFYLIYPDLRNWVIRKQTNCVTPTANFLLDGFQNCRITYNHATNNGVTRLSNKSGCDQLPKRPPALKKRGQSLATGFITIATY
jgi:hypothetical protein